MHTREKSDLAHTVTRPHVVRVLEQTRTALFVFDDAVCDLSSGMDGAVIAREIHDRLFAAGYRMSLFVAIDPNPIGMMWYAHSVDSGIGAEAAELLRKAEAAAATAAVPVPGVQEAFHACHARGRNIAVVGDTSSVAMERYLDMHGLRQLVGAVIGREHLFSLPASLQTGVTLLQRTMQALDAKPSDSALVTLTPHRIYTAKNAGLNSIGIVNKRGARKHLTGPPGGVAVSSMAHLASGFTSVPVLSA
jgi:beta-phosphoglucomutase-like phosphatase (HAD superfamily)